MSVPTTSHYGLKKPDGYEEIKPDDFNYNADIIDTELYKNRVITGTTAPTSATVGAVGQYYLNTANGMLYQCKSINGNSYSWIRVETLEVGDIIQSCRALDDSWALCNGTTLPYSKYPKLQQLTTLTEAAADWGIKSFTVIGTKTAPSSVSVAKANNKIFALGVNASKEIFIDEITSADDDITLHYIASGYSLTGSMTHGNGYYGIAITNGTTIGYLYCSDSVDIYNYDNWHVMTISLSTYHSQTPSGINRLSVLFVNGYFALAVEAYNASSYRSGGIFYSTNVANAASFTEVTNSSGTNWSTSSPGYGSFFIYNNGYYITGSEYNTSNSAITYGTNITDITTRSIISGIDSFRGCAGFGSTALGILTGNGSTGYLHLNLSGVPTSFTQISLPVAGYAYGFWVENGKMYVGMYNSSAPTYIYVYESPLSTTPTWTAHKVCSISGSNANNWSFGSNIWAAGVYISSVYKVLIGDKADLFPLGRTLPTLADIDAKAHNYMKVK